jgi:hypothetical protein
MQVKKVTFGRTVSVGNFSNVRADIEIELSPEDLLAEAWEMAINQVGVAIAAAEVAQRREWDAAARPHFVGGCVGCEGDECLGESDECHAGGENSPFDLYDDVPDGGTPEEYDGAPDDFEIPDEDEPPF